MKPVEAIALATLPHFGLGQDDLDQLLRGQRSHTLSEARAVVCWVARRRHAWSYPEIARAVGYRNHSSAIDAVQAVERRPVLYRIAVEVLAALPGANKREPHREFSGAREIEMEEVGT